MLLGLEAGMRAAVRRKRPVHTTDRAVLMDIFSDIEDGSGTVDISEFIEVGPTEVLNVTSSLWAHLPRDINK